MKIIIDQELEDAHQAYENEKSGILYDLLSLEHALLYYYAEKKLTKEDYEEFSKVIENTYKFIKEGERI